jgi:hypothetical protein
MLRHEFDQKWNLIVHTGSGVRLNHLVVDDEKKIHILGIINFGNKFADGQEFILTLVILSLLDPCLNPTGNVAS